MPPVPNWIAKAVVLYANKAVPTTEWRATKTQVIVRTEPTGPEIRFYLDGLRRVGDHGFSAVLLVAPDDPRVIDLNTAQVVNDARYTVLNEVDNQRLQDSSQDAETVAAKLTAIQGVVNKALASLAEVL